MTVEPALAFDRGSVRSYDSDGHLRVDTANISAAVVNPYFGREIPGGAERGLEPDRVYKLFRDPAELMKAAPTFAGKPILIAHKSISADDHPHEKVVGAIGTDVQFNSPFLTASLTFWDREAIDLIESGKQRALSCGYRYTPVWEPGVFDGESYDARMTNIEANHLALVVEGRAGPAVVIGDAKLEEDASPPTEENLRMPATLLTRKAALAHGGVIGYLASKLAADAKIDLTPVFAPINAANFSASKATIAAAIGDKVKGKLVAGVTLDDLPKFLGAFDEMDPAEEDKDKDKSKDRAKDRAKDKKAKDSDDDDVKEAYEEGYEDGMKDGEEKAEKASGDKAKDKKAKDAESDKDKKDDDDKKDKANDEMVSRTAMDSALKASVKLAEQNVMERMKDAREAERFIRPWVGELPTAFDSAEEIYRAAAVALKVPDADTVHVSALKSMISMMPKPGEKSNVTRLATDSRDRSTNAAAEFSKMFPTARLPRAM